MGDKTGEGVPTVAVGRPPLPDEVPRSQGRRSRASIAGNLPPVAPAPAPAPASTPPEPSAAAPILQPVANSDHDKPSDDDLDEIEQQDRDDQRALAIMQMVAAGYLAGYEALPPEGDPAREAAAEQLVDMGIKAMPVFANLIDGKAPDGSPTEKPSDDPDEDLVG